MLNVYFELVAGVTVGVIIELCYELLDDLMDSVQEMTSIGLLVFRDFGGDKGDTMGRDDGVGDMEMRLFFAEVLIEQDYTAH